MLYCSVSQTVLFTCDTIKIRALRMRMCLANVKLSLRIISLAGVAGDEKQMKSTTEPLT